MRLNVDSSVVGSSTTLLVVSGVIDWSTVTQFRSSLSPHVCRPKSNVLVDLTGLLSWSSPAQAALVGAIAQARLQDGRLAVFGLGPVPARQAESSGLYRALHAFATRADAQAGAQADEEADAQASPEPPRTPTPPAAAQPRPIPAADRGPVATRERRRRRADATARWAVQRQQRWRFVNQVKA
jgi:anti-anti-sigma factor